MNATRRNSVTQKQPNYTLNDIPTILHALLRIKRRHCTVGEEIGSALILNHLEKHNPDKVEVDPIGNIHVAVGKSTLMFTSHIDTVHHEDGEVSVQINKNTGMIHTGNTSVLGADDAAGIYIMLEMIKARVNGYYIFHVGEECGGIGSSYIVDKEVIDLTKFTHCISFDRKGTTDIITHQMERCASDTFGNALGEAIAMHSGGDIVMVNDDSGIFTDSANYAHIIPECTNISVGYYDEHTSRERLDLPFLLQLVDTLTDINWEELPCLRDPVRDNEYRDGFHGSWNKVVKNKCDDLVEMVDLIQSFPTEVAEHLIDQGYDAYELAECIDHFLGEP